MYFVAYIIIIAIDRAMRITIIWPAAENFMAIPVRI
jgi:hypothetical protein